MVWTYHGIDNTHGIDLNSWYSIDTPESHMYERAECCPYAGFLFDWLELGNKEISNYKARKLDS